MARGGKRPGAGRKVGSKASHTLTTEQGRAYLIARVHAELEPIVTKAIEQAKAGDQATRKDLLDRAWGRPKETLEVQGEMKLMIDV